MYVDEKGNRISMLGEFSDQNLEKEFFYDYMSRSIKYIRPIILVFGILNMLFIIPDYYFIKSQEAFLRILINRTMFLLLVIFFFFLINIFKNYKLLACWITGYEILASILFFMIFGQYNRPNFLIQAFGVMVLILVIFTVPNKWVYALISAIFVSVSFFIFTKTIYDDIFFSEYLAGYVYILIVLCLSAIGAFRSNYYNRRQYVYRKELMILSSTDWLTGIYNRSKCNQELEYWISYAKRYDIPLSLVFFDIDNFKKINDDLGHLMGDKIIVDIVEFVKNNIRENDMFARWGGDEFILLFPNTDKKQASYLVERLRLGISNNYYEEVANVTCSFGLAMANENDNADTLVNRADKLLYESKLRGKNTVSTE